MDLLDQYTKEEVEKIVSESYSIREILIKLGYTCMGRGNYNTLYKYIEENKISTSHFKRKRIKRLTLEDVFCENSSVGQSTLRRYSLKENIHLYICAICGQEPIWQGKPLTLTLDHINGHNHDNRIENLRWVCPNCDTQSDTYGAKNIQPLKKGEQHLPFNSFPPIEKKEGELIQKPSREELKTKLREKSYTQIGYDYNVSPTTIRKWCKSYNLPYMAMVIKHTSDEGWINENWNDIVILPETLEGKRERLKKPVAKLDKNSLEILDVYDSLFEAKKNVTTNISGHTHIAGVCTGKRKSAYGYSWKFITKEEYKKIKKI